eukprot:m.410889 g.410889  ORF g.410889 m.410889 type:complete len:93 (+) comp28509_c0_seq1:56-334(+)
MTDFIYGFVLAEAEAEKLDQGIDAPAGLHRVTIPQGDGNVLWGHGIIDSGKKETEGAWETTDMANCPHITSSVIEYVKQLVAGQAAMLYTRA